MTGLFGIRRRSGAPLVHMGERVEPEREARVLAELFSAVYGMPPAGVWRAPAAAAVIGDDGPLGDGVLLSVALPWGASVALAPATDGVVQVRRAERPRRVVRGDATVAVLTALAEAGYGLPSGTGVRVLVRAAPLGGVAPLIAAVLLALAEVFAGPEPSRERASLVRIAHRAHEGAPGNPADLDASLRCAEGRALLTDRRSGTGRTMAFALAGAGLRLLITDTGAARAADQFAARRVECDKAAAQLEVASLRDVDDLSGALTVLHDPALRLRARHVVTEGHRVNALVGLLRAGAAGDIGALLNSSHLSLRDALGVSTPQVDAAVDTAARRGARGGRMSGPLGLALSVVPEGRAAPIAEAVAAAFAAHRWSAPVFFNAVPAGGAGRVG
ncbi:galactokinase [Nocardiopsis ansamitocini]|uniref:Galactokinase n=1 Tax=Nocardiopsis ansamitocini TaxID=1670832 RepID=A0A9W6UKZ2_9ACTN|nr:galactokinase [Nocardiopsis ansamitocini]GLU49565.1 galactokinase [Nocardiopsis ansamitocini]